MRSRDPGAGSTLYAGATPERARVDLSGVRRREDPAIEKKRSTGVAAALRGGSESVPVRGVQEEVFAQAREGGGASERVI